VRTMPRGAVSAGLCGEDEDIFDGKDGNGYGDQSVPCVASRGRRSLLALRLDTKVRVV
jgi:hypothetical protein